MKKKWISVNEMKPEKNINVLVFDIAFGIWSITTASWNGKEWRDYNDNPHAYNDDITHWRKMPNKPKIK